MPCSVVSTAAEVTRNWWKTIAACAIAADVIMALVLILCLWRKAGESVGGLCNLLWPFHSYQFLVPLWGEKYERKELIKNAIKAQQAERFEDMTKYLVKVIKMDQRLSFYERHLLKEAYYDLVKVPRTLLRNLEYESTTRARRRKNVNREDREEIEIQLKMICDEVLQLLDKFLIKESSNATRDEIEEYVFYLAMKGDYNRYKIICKSIQDKMGLIDEAKKAYEEAMSLSIEMLPPAHSTRLAISMKLSVFNFEVLRNYEEACRLTRTAINHATEDFESPCEDLSESSERVPYMLALHKNLAYWTNAMKDATGNDSDRHNEM